MTDTAVAPTTPPDTATGSAATALRVPTTAKPRSLLLSPVKRSGLADQMKAGLDAPICLTWELTYACNLQCIHCLSSSGRRDPRELTTTEAEAVIDELERMQVFYINIGGGEPTIRSDFWHLVDYATDHGVGVKFSTNGSRIDASVARRLAASDYIDVQISIDGADAATNDAVRGEGSFEIAQQAMKAPAQSSFQRLQDLGGDDPSQHRPSRRVGGHGRPLRCRVAAHPLPAFGARG